MAIQAKMPTKEHEIPVNKAYTRFGNYRVCDSAASGAYCFTILEMEYWQSETKRRKFPDHPLKVEPEKIPDWVPEGTRDEIKAEGYRRFAKKKEIENIKL